MWVEFAQESHNFCYTSEASCKSCPVSTSDLRQFASGNHTNYTKGCRPSGKQSASCKACQLRSPAPLLADQLGSLGCRRGRASGCQQLVAACERAGRENHRCLVIKPLHAALWGDLLPDGGARSTFRIKACCPSIRISKVSVLACSTDLPLKGQGACRNHDFIRTWCISAALALWAMPFCNQ